jgi:hypothetical protein
MSPMVKAQEASRGELLGEVDLRIVLGLIPFSTCLSFYPFYRMNEVVKSCLEIQALNKSFVSRYTIFNGTECPVPQQ